MEDLAKGCSSPEQPWALRYIFLRPQRKTLRHSFVECTRLTRMNDTAIDEVRYRLLHKDTKDHAKFPPIQGSSNEPITQSQFWYLANIPVPAHPSPIEGEWFKDPASG